MQKFTKADLFTNQNTGKAFTIDEYNKDIHYDIYPIVGIKIEHNKTINGWITEEGGNSIKGLDNLMNRLMYEPT